LGLGDDGLRHLDESSEYKALPEHPLDNHFELVRFNLIGPLGKFRRGPLGVASPGDDEDADGYSDGDW